MADTREIFEEARVAMRGSSPSGWRKILDEARRRAQDAEGPTAIARFALLAATHLTAEGHEDAADRELRLALQLVDRDGEVGAHLRVLLALGQASRGRPMEALRSVADLASSRQRPLLERASLMILRLSALQFERIPECLQLIEELRAAGDVPAGTSLRLWLTQLYAVSGRADDARLMASLMVDEARAHGSSWRQDLARAYLHALDVAERGHHEAPPVEPPHPHGQWVLSLIGEYQARTRSFRPAELRIPPSNAMRAALEDLRAPIARPPARVSLANLGAALARGEDAATAEDPGLAAEWLRVVRSWPSGVSTSLEFPASRLRIEALLQARVGQVNAAIERMAQAIAWSDAMRYRCEAVMARAQQAALLGWSGTARADWVSLRSAAKALSDRHAIPWEPAAARAGEVMAHASGEAQARALSEREREAVRLLGEGMSYRMAAEQMGISWRTVQNHAYRAYRKLGVHGAAEAYERAQRDGVI